MKQPVPASFCMYPWNNLRIDANGEGRLCSSYEHGNISDGDIPMPIDRHALSEIWNSDAMRAVRGDMVAGRPIAGCRMCQSDEAAGGLSKRLVANANFESGWLNESGATIEQMIALATDNDLRLPLLPSTVEIEVGNLCNFKCRMCNGNLSSMIAKDPVHQAWAANQFCASHDGPHVQSNRDNFRQLKSLANLSAKLADPDCQIKRLYFIGGEPLLVREIGTLLEELIAAGRAQHISLLFVSNGSVIPSWFSLAKQFRHVDVTVSIDGYGDLHNYIRYPGRWPDLVENLQALREIPNVHVVATTTISMLNVLSVTRLFRYLDSVDIGLSAYLLHWPRYLMVGALPSSVRRLAAMRLKEYGVNDCRPHHRALVLSLAAQCEADDNSVGPELLRDFMLFTNDLDASRGQSIHRTDPELVELLEAAGFTWLDETLHGPAKGLAQTTHRWRRALMELQTATIKLERELGEARTATIKLEHELVQARASVTRANEQTEHARLDLDQVYASHIWRVTRPYRVTRQAFLRWLHGKGQGTVSGRGLPTRGRPQVRYGGGDAMARLPADRGS